VPGILIIQVMRIQVFLLALPGSFLILFLMKMYTYNRLAYRLQNIKIHIFVSTFERINTENSNQMRLDLNNLL